jgi:4-hydroxy-3-methylbut-2-enyl diphosphate reductase
MSRTDVDIEIDSGSGFCFGVTRAIGKAEEELAKGERLSCLGDIVHNGKECERLRQLGLITIEREDLAHLHGEKVLLRAHGEPPATYQTAEANDIEVIDATCPVVLALQRRIKQEYEAQKDTDEQIVIYGKNGHAEVLGLVGQTEGHAIVVEDMDDVRRLDFRRDIRLYSQTTKSVDSFRQIVSYIDGHIVPPATFKSYDTICRQVANRMPNIREFAAHHDLIFFVSGHKSSNGRVLFAECKSVNANTYLIDDASEIDPVLLKRQIDAFGKNATGAAPKVTSGRDAGADGDKNANGGEAVGTNYKIGICGATSTPKWLMEQCKVRIQKLLGGNE